jgi:hypothetical protein
LVRTAGINVQSNSYDAGYTTKASNSGTGNTIGGGSACLLKRDIDHDNDNSPMWLEAVG